MLWWIVIPLLTRRLLSTSYSQGWRTTWDVADLQWPQQVARQRCSKSRKREVHETSSSGHSLQTQSQQGVGELTALHHLWCSSAQMHSGLGVWARYMIGIWVLALGMNGIVWLLALLVIGIEHTPVIIGMVYWHSVWLLSMIIRLLSMNSIWLAFLKAGMWTLDCSELVY